MRVIRRRIAAQRVRSFFSMFGKMSVAIIAGMFYGAVRRSQALVRSFFTCRRARVTSLALLLRREMDVRREAALDAEKALAEERIAQLTPGNRRRSTLQQELQLIYAQYDSTHANVLDILGLAEEGLDGFEGISIKGSGSGSGSEEHAHRSVLLEMADAFLTRRKREHVVEHGEAHKEALVLYNAPAERKLSVEDMRQIVNKSALAQAKHLYAATPKVKPRWPMLFLYTRALKDAELLEQVEKLAHPKVVEIETCNVALELPPHHRMEGGGGRREKVADAENE